MENKNILLYSILFISLLFFSITYADSNGVWHYASDIRGGVFGSDEQDVTGGFSFVNLVSFNDFVNINQGLNISGNVNLKDNLNVNGNITQNGTHIATLDNNGKVPINQLPFHKGDLLAPVDRPLISGQSGYNSYYFDIYNLGINPDLTASKVAYGINFGLNGNIHGNYTSDGTATSNKIVTGYSAYIKGVKVNGSLSLDSLCSSAGGNANCGATSSISPGVFYSIIGSNSPTNTNYCTRINVGSSGSVTSTNVNSAGICKLILSCTSSSQTVSNYPDGTSCGTNMQCQAGSCVNHILLNLGVFGAAYNGGEQIGEHNIIKNAMVNGIVYSSSNVNSCYRNSIAHFVANNGAYFKLNGVNIGNKITIVHKQDWVGISNSICGSGCSTDLGCSYYSSWGRTTNYLQLYK